MTGRDILLGLALAEHPGDVNDYLPELAGLLGEPRPVWSERWDRLVFPWESSEDED